MGAQLRDTEIMLASAERLAGLGSWVWDIRRDRLTWSEGAYRVLGMHPASFGGTLEGFLERMHPEDREPLRSVVRSALAGQRQFGYCYRLVGEDGRERLIQGDGEVQCDDRGGAVRLVGTVVDITQRESERRAVDESEQRFRSLLALSSDWYWQQDADLRFAEFHPKAARHDAVLGLRRWEVPDFTPVNTTWDEHRKLLAARLPFRDLEVRQCLGRAVRYVSVSGEPFHDADGVFLGYRGTARDITERVAAEERLRQLNASLRMAMRLGRSGVWWADVPQRSVSWWDGGRVIFALDGSATATVDQVLQRVDPCYRGTLDAALEQCIGQGEPFDVEVPLLAGINPGIWVRLIGEAQRDAGGEVRCVQGTLQDVTERRLAAERARELGTRLAATLDGVSDAFLTLNRDGVFTYLNQEAERLLQRGRGELLGRSLWREFPGVEGSCLERELRRALAERETVEFEDFFEPLQVWLKVKAYASPQGLAVYFRDITDSHSVHQALTDSQEELRHLFENAIDGVLCTGSDDRVVRANPAVCAMLGRTDQELRGSPFTALLQPGETGLPALWEQRGMTGRTSGRLGLVRGDGSPLPVELSSAEYTAADGSVRAFVVLRDISQRLRAEQDILQLNAELGERVRRRTEELEGANAELKALAHSLAHDLQSPVAAIEGFSELLQGALPQPLPERAAHYLDRIRSGARKTSEYAQGLLALARVTQAPLWPRRVDLGELATDLLMQLAERDRERSVEWTVQEDQVVQGDPTLLRILLDNLLGNAWKFTRDRSPARIAFGGAPGDDHQFVFHVRDNGSGFDMAHAHRLFGNFQRLHTQEEFPGTGLGLATVQRIVARHGGRAWADSVEGEGATFYFTLPPGPSEK